MSDSDINDFVPSLLNPRRLRKYCDYSLTQNSTISRYSLSLKKNRRHKISNPRRVEDCVSNKENIQNNNSININKNTNINTNKLRNFTPVEDTFGNSAIENFSEKVNSDFSIFSFSPKCGSKPLEHKINETVNPNYSYHSFEQTELSVSFSVSECKNVEIDTERSNFKKVLMIQDEKGISVKCNIIESKDISSIDSMSLDETMSLQNVDSSIVTKKSLIYVNVEIKRTKLPVEKEKSQINKVLILNTDAIGNVSNVIVQPSNYKLVKRQIFDKSKLKRRKTNVSGPLKRNSKVIVDRSCDKWKQKSIIKYLNRHPACVDISSDSDRTLLLEKNSHYLEVDNDYIQFHQGTNITGDGEEMSKNSGFADSVNSELRTGKYNKPRKNEHAPKSPTLRSDKGQKKQSLRTSSAVNRSPPPKQSFDTVPTISSHSPRRSIETPEHGGSKTKSIKTGGSSKSIPHYKIVAGTHFAVDAFSYGDIPNVKHYFLTHFHSDHYAGLKKSFSKTLFCSKISAELCVSRLGVNPKCISIINPDEMLKIDSVEVTAVDANHCPGAIMLVFSLPNGKTILHTGDFRATPAMESYPIFWNKDIHTVYLDTTYCNPRYDFPTQDQSLEMALYMLRQKKLAVEKAGKSFSSVLIVCGTYTIGKEKFLIGVARRVGCSIWACPEKAMVLEAVEGHSVNQAPPHACQLHALPMRDLTYEKLQNYLDSFHGTFCEVVAFKPSGWENGKNSTVEKDKVTIHGIPYSEHSSFSEMVRFIKYLKPKLVVPTVDISGGVKAVQKYFPCPLVHKEDESQARVTDYFSIQRQQVSAVT